VTELLITSRRLWMGLVVAVVLLGGALVSWFPARQVVDQRRETARAEQRMAELGTEVAALSERAAALERPDEIARLARDRLDLVEPGQESYRIILPPSGTVPLPRGWPFLLAEPAAPGGG
jgi:cell division protein FtsB